MWSLELFTLVAASFAAQAASLTVEPNHQELNELRTRNIVYDGKIDETYDFVICGGGAAGLVLAARLSEDSNTTVLVLEAGQTGDEVKSSIDVPGNAYYKSLLNTAYDWAYKTVPQKFSGDRVLPWPRGKVLGGSSAINGMYYVRPSELEFEAWAGLNSEDPNASAWTWESMFTMMKKSETFHPPTDEVAKAGDIRYDAASHGDSGPLHSSYPGFIPPVVGSWTETLEWIGIPRSPDANSGKGWGGFVATSFINPGNWTRSYGRSYIDPLPPRSNLHILAEASVTRLVWDSASPANNKTASGVEYATREGGAKKVINVRKEVLLAGGAVGSPQILMVSGVGPKDVLEAAGVKVVVDLPGVGQHLQDHIAAEVVWKTSAVTAATIHKSGTLPNGTAASPFLSFINSATAYANVTDLLGDFGPTFRDNIAAALDTSAATLSPSTSPEVTEGYKAIYKATVDKILMSQVGQVELLFSLTGTGVGGDDSIAIQSALQHPISMGRLWITSPDVFIYPSIDPNYLSHSADTIMMREGLKLARKLGNTEPLKSVMLKEVSPGDTVQTDAEWDAWLTKNIQTEYHPSCTCAMLPRAHGGVVNANLQVYGLSNVRVADSSVYPIQFAAHLAAPTFGLGEQAASIIRAFYAGIPPPSAVTTGVVSAILPAASGTGNGNGGTNGNGASGTSNSGAMQLQAITVASALSAVLVAVLSL